MPSYKVLPYVMEELKEANVKEEDVTIVLALGSHRPHTEEEKKTLVGEAVYNSGVNVIDSDMKKCINFGKCKNGTPVIFLNPLLMQTALFAWEM